MVNAEEIVDCSTVHMVRLPAKAKPRLSAQDVVRSTSSQDQYAATIEYSLSSHIFWIHVSSVHLHPVPIAQSWTCFTHFSPVDSKSQERITEMKFKDFI